jgi:hypothetical protein
MAGLVGPNRSPNLGNVIVQVIAPQNLTACVRMAQNTFMRFNCSQLCIAVILAFEVVAQAAPFVVFPKAGQLPSPDGRFVVRNIDREAPLSEYVGAFHSLFLEETASGLSRKLCDYVGVAAVAWAKNDSIIVTQYVSKQTSRALVFAASDSRDPVVIDKSSLTRLVPAYLRPPLRENDHVFVEASRVEGETLTLRVWGYGKHDAEGFRWICEYSLLQGRIFCAETPVLDK